MGGPNKHSEISSKKPKLHESVQSLIDKKKKEKESEVSASVSEKMAGTQEGVAEVMAGAEKPKEQISERKGETGEKGDISGGGGTSDGDDAQVVSANLKDYHFPNEEVMVQKVRAAINVQIKSEWKKALKFKGSLDSGGASNYNQAISRIRKLKDALASLFTATFAYMKGMYVKYFTPDGKRRKFDDL